MELTLHNSDARLTVSDTVFGAPYNEPLVHQIVTAYQAGGRSGTKAQKSKGEVRGGGKKPWKQKGTGQARSGSIRSPLWRGGGVTFAAENRDFSQKVNRKMYRGAMRSILSELLRRDLLRVVDTFTVDAVDTGAFKAKLAEMGLTSVTIVANDLAENLFLSARNIPYVSITDVHGLDPVTLLASKHVVVTTDAVKKIEEWLA